MEAHIVLIALERQEITKVTHGAQTPLEPPEEVTEAHIALIVLERQETTKVTHGAQIPLEPPEEAMGQIVIPTPLEQCVATKEEEQEILSKKLPLLAVKVSLRLGAPPKDNLTPKRRKQSSPSKTSHSATPINMEWLRMP